MKKWMILILLVLVIPVVYGMEMCQSTVEVGTNCTMLTPALTCSAYNYTIINLSGSQVRNGSLAVLSGNIYQFNFTESEGDYIVQLCDGTTREVSVEVEESSMIIIAIIILLPMLLSLIMLVGAATMSDDHGALKIGLFLFSIIPFFLSMHFGLISIIQFIPSFTAMQDLIGSTSYYAGMFLFILVSYFVIYMIYSIFTGMNEKKKEDLEY